MIGLSEVDMYFVYYICALLCGCKCYARCNEKERRFTYVKQQGMLTVELSSYVLGIPNDAYTTLSQNLIDCTSLSQEH